MPGLELFIDAKGMRTGAAEAQRALETVGATAVRTEQTVVNVNKALTTTAGAREAAASITSTAAALNGLNTAGAAFSASKLLLDISRLREDFAGITAPVSTAAQTMRVFNNQTLAYDTVTVAATATTGRFTNVMRTLGAVIRANPLLVVATALSTAASLMSVFGQSTTETTRAIKSQADAIDSLLSKTRQLDYGRGLGLADPRSTAQGLGSTLTTLLTSERRDFSAGEAAGLYGVSELELRQALSRSGEDSALFPARSGADDQFRLTRYGQQYARSSFTRDEVRAAGELLLRERQRADSVYARSTRASPFAGTEGYGDGSLLTTTGYTPAFSRGEYLRTTETDAMHAMQSGRALQEAKEKADRAEEERLQRNMEMADQLGDAIGGALASGILGAQSMKQAFASLFADFAQQGIRAATRGLTGAIFGQFGETTAQRGGTPASTPD